MLETNAQRSEERVIVILLAHWLLFLPPLRAAVQCHTALCTKGALTFFFFFSVWLIPHLCMKLLGGKALCVGWRDSGLDKCTPGLFLVTCSQPFPQDGHGRVLCLQVSGMGFVNAVARGSSKNTPLAPLSDRDVSRTLVLLWLVLYIWLV